MVYKTVTTLLKNSIHFLPCGRGFILYKNSSMQKPHKAVCKEPDLSIQFLYAISRDIIIQPFRLLYGYHSSLKQKAHSGLSTVGVEGSS